MLMEAVEKWRKKQAPPMFKSDIDEGIFSIFFQEHCVGKSFMVMLTELAYEIYELQVCVDGLLEDNE